MASAAQPTMSTSDLFASLSQTQLSAETLPQPQLPAETLPQTQLSAETLPQTQLSAETLPQPQLPAETLPQTQLSVETLPQTQLSAETLPQPQLSAETLPQPQLSAETLPQPQLSAETLPQPQLSLASEGRSSSHFMSQHEPHQPSPTVPANITPDPSASSSKSNYLPECLMHKNRLQEYTQRSGLQLPVYHIVNEGLQHAPRFRANVLVDDVTYTSSSTFLHRKEAEQDVAKLALQCISRKVRDGGCVPIHEVSAAVWKLVLNEFSAKMCLQKPVYNTVQHKGPLPLFVSCLFFNGSTYTGNAGKNKKEAEQLAARAAIESILGNSDSRVVLNEIIKSKVKLYTALDKVKDMQYVGYNGSAFSGEETNGLKHLPGNCKEAAIVAATESNVSNAGVTQSSAASFPPHHVFEKTNQGSSFEAVNLPITFVQEAEVKDASSHGKRKRKNKKKPNKKLRTVDPLAPYAVMPMNQNPACPVGQ